MVEMWLELLGWVGGLGQRGIGGEKARGSQGSGRSR